MNFSTAVLFCCIAAFSTANSNFYKDEAVKRFQMTLEQCKQEVGATTADIQELFDRKAASALTGKCLRACLMKKFQIMDSNDQFVETTALDEARKFTNGDALKMRIVQNLTNICRDIQVSADHCEAAADYGNCFRQQIRVLKLPQH